MSGEISRSCAFTGYRPNRFPFGSDERNPQCKKIKLALLSAAKWLHDQRGVEWFYSGCAMGVDLWAASAVLYLRSLRGYEDVKLFCAIPFPGHTERWKEEQKEKFEKILNQCDERKYIGQQYSGHIYQQRNEFMVDQTKYLVGVYDVNQKNIRSGTGQTIRYARKQEKGILIIDPQTANIQQTNMDANKSGYPKSE